jgi:hypothetical protein
LVLLSAACEGTSDPSADNPGTVPEPPGMPDTPGAPAGAVFLVIDDDGIDNGSKPNEFTAIDVNDGKAEVGVRDQLPYFAEHVGDTIDLFSGDLGDEGWHALPTPPPSWVSTFLEAGPGLGSLLLDKIPNVTPLRATALKMLVGQTICAVVYDGDVGITYNPLMGDLRGANLGVVAFEVLQVTRLVANSSSLPRVTIAIRDADTVCGGPLVVFANAPKPISSGDPFDVVPPATAPAAEFTTAP